nr:arylsulfatase [Dactylosporangium thailandense]
MPTELNGSDMQHPDPRLEPAPFGGVVADTVADSTPWWAPAVRPGDGAPNIVMIVLDDVGYGQIGCYGAATDTPAMNALAAHGARFANFHVTGLCSTTRSSLLTGRNHHAVGVGFLADFDTGFPGYRGAVTPRAATLAEMLRDAGYGTYAVGKWHLTPPAHMTPAGPFHQWPTGRGFDRYYGFLWGEDDQWAPDLWQDQHHVEPPRRDGYHLSEDLVDRAQRYVADHVSAAPDRPFFLYLAFGACHAPHQAPREYLERYRGRFDHGWDVEREHTLRRQIALGVVPPGTTLPPPNEGVANWADLDDDQHRLYARMQEVFAGFMEHTDAQIGRLVEYLRGIGELDNTLLVVLSDNGASGEGGADGSANEYRYFLGLADRFEDALEQIDELGGPATHNHYPSGWAQAGNTPLKLYKKHTFGGGVRAPLIVHWPGRIAAPGTVRTQFHHVIDILPTVLQAAGVRAPTSHRGVPQLPVHGTSMLYTLDEPGTAGQRRQQYFETAGHRGIYRDGWKAVTTHRPGTPFDTDRFELYRLDEDFAELHDLAAEHPAIVADLVAAWWDDARAYGVLPLDDRMQSRVAVKDPAWARTRYRLLPGARLANGPAGPDFAGRHFTVTARLERHRPGDDGVLLAYGRRAAGFSFFVADGRLSLDLNLAGRHTVVTAPEPLALGPAAVALTLAGDHSGAEAAFTVDGVEVHRAPVPAVLPAGLGCLSLQCGHNSPSPVSPHYEPPFTFAGTLHEVFIDLGPTVTEPHPAAERPLAMD